MELLDLLLGMLEYDEYADDFKDMLESKAITEKDAKGVYVAKSSSQSDMYSVSKISSKRSTHIVIHISRQRKEIQKIV